MKPQKLKDILKDKLTKLESNYVPRAYDIIGDIAVFERFPAELIKKEKIIGNALLGFHPHVKVVCRKTRKYAGKFRLPKLKIIAGEKRKETVHKESGVMLKLDVEKVYFSPRMASERLRIASQVKPRENIMVMFSGCAPYPLVLSKNTQAKEIYGIEINPIAHRYALENARLNKAVNVKLFLGDVKKVIPRLKKRFDRILMPLPKGGENFLEDCFKATRKNTIIHFYDFEHEDELKKSQEKVDKACKRAGKKYEILRIVKCGQYAPRFYRICADIKLK